MKISLQWLSDYIEVSEFFAQPEELEKKLTAAGLEVENMENQAEQFKSVVIGQIVELKKHPDADKLTLCQVQVGEGNPQPIVCGAKNHKQNDKVVVALPGAILPGNFEIKKSKIRGQESQGMLCSEKELGLSDEADGIIILPEEAPVGEAFAEYKNLKDVIFELSVTPNRADCLSHFGLARELATLTGKKVKKPIAKIKAGKEKVQSRVDLQLKNSISCPRYCGRGIYGVAVGESPAWLKTRLESVGVNSINNIVDVTNYVMMELGQPLHAFDEAEIQGQAIIIDNSKPKEKFKTLDGTEIQLSGEELTIRDNGRVVALAGVVGGLNSGVTEKTRDIFLESAHFTQDSVRKTSRKFGIDTDSGYRFSRGTDPEGVLEAMNRACELIQQVAGGEISADHYDLYPNPIKRKPIQIKKKYLETRLGYSIEGSDFETWMKRLDCDVKSIGEGHWEVKSPAFRWDIEIPEDLVEEFARLHGYDQIPETLPPLATSPTRHDSQYELENLLADLMSQEGYHQAVNYGFVGSNLSKEILGGSETFNPFGLEFSDQPISIVNPLNEETNVMRVSLLPGLIKNFLHNYRRGGQIGRLFELGSVFYNKEDQYLERTRLGLVAWGQNESLWDKNQSRPVVFDLKTAIENILDRLHIRSYQWRKIDSDIVTPHMLHPSQSVGLFLEGRMAGFIGTLHPSMAQKEKIRHGVAVAEFDFDKLMRGQPRIEKTKSISKFPAVERDLAFVIPKDLPTYDLKKEISKLAGQLLQSLEVFDVYEGDKLPDGQRSVAFKMVYQDLQRTLSEEQLTDLQNKIIQGIEKKFSVQVR